MVSGRVDDSLGFDDVDAIGGGDDDDTDDDYDWRDEDTTSEIFF